MRWIIAFTRQDNLSLACVFLSKIQAKLLARGCWHQFGVTFSFFVGQLISNFLLRLPLPICSKEADVCVDKCL